MELVYLWVEKYKNIYHQGFNFSPRFECTFHDEYETDENGNEKLKDNCILDIKPKEHIENFFGENINVTAIVGENGSGKSGILECLAEIFRIEYNKNMNLIVDDDHNFSFFLAFKIKGKTYEIKSNNRDSHSFEDTEKIENILDYYIYSNDKSNIEKQILLDNSSIAKMIVHDYSKNKKFKLSSFMYIPNQIKIDLCDFGKKFEELISNSKLYPMSRNESDTVYIQNMSNSINSQINLFNLIEDKYHQFLILKLLEKSQQTLDFGLAKEDIMKQLSDSELLTEEDFNQYFNFAQDLLNYQKKEIDNLTSQEKEIYIDKYSDFFEFDFIDDKTRKYSDLSHGEKTLFGQLLNVYYFSKKSDNQNLLFLFDEPEISLHPRWQQSYINELYDLLKKLDKNYQFIFASHSPFILSDLPKENVIFLEKDEQTGYCKNVTKETNINTFGANIHNLLSHGFFMKDGLIGAFAKGKINTAITYLNKKQLSEEEIEYCENIISIIGEPILKRQLQKMLDSKRLSEVEHIKQQIKELQEELAKKEDKK
jgi:predicted ATP-dependent endonuclease of OLD family